MTRLILPLFLVAALSGPRVSAQDMLERLDDALQFSAWDDAVRASLSGRLDLETYQFSRPAPGLIFTESDELFNPRLTLFLDAQLGPKVYAFAQARVDRGFDPSDDGLGLRLDTWAARYTPWDDGTFSIQAGKFASAVGTWAARSYSWENPFITAPSAYENLTGVWDSAIARSGDELRAWSHVTPTPWLPSESADKHLRVPIAWGPSYGTGLAIMGSLGELEYNFEIKNTSPSSRPEAWDVTETGFSNPTFSGRIGWRPNLLWRFGASASVGSYLLPEARSSLPAGEGIGDYRQIVLAQDASFEWHHWQVWAEIFEARFEHPFGDADTIAYYIEAKYKFSPQMFGALRFNQQLFGDVPIKSGSSEPWGADLWRVDSAFGWRPTEYTQLKLQYSIQREQAAEHDIGHLFATQFTVRF